MDPHPRQPVARSPGLLPALGAVRAWAGPRGGAYAAGPDSAAYVVGVADVVLPWASVTKLVTALAVLRDVEDGTIALEEPAGPPGATVRHLLAHAAGLPFEGADPIAPPETTRIYSNSGYDVLGELLAERHGEPVGAVLAERVLGPLGMAETRLAGRPGDGLEGPLRDLAALAGTLRRPTLVSPGPLVSPGTLETATRVAFPGLRGVLPGFGRYDPLDWGLGLEIRGGKAPHWMGSRTSPATFGHFGGSGSFVWVDPAADVTLAVVSDRAFGTWAADAWPALSDSVLEALGPA